MQNFHDEFGCFNMFCIKLLIKKARLKKKEVKDKLLDCLFSVFKIYLIIFSVKLFYFRI